MNKKNWLIILIAVIILSGVSVWLYKDKLAIHTHTHTPEITFNSGITKVADGSFGSLSQVAANETSQALDERSSTSPLNEGVGGGGLSESSEASVKEIAMPAPSQFAYHYIYNGEDFSIEETQKNVFKRVKNADIGKAFAQHITSIDTDLMDLSKFQDVNIESLNLVEDREFGYSVYFNFQDSSAYIGQNWKKWPNPFAKCSEQKCYDENYLNIGDVPADEEIVRISDDFMREYGVDMTMYGQGEVLQSWREQYVWAEKQSVEDVKMYIPDSISVIYPIILGGQTVYDQSGNKAGLYVNVDIRNKKVSSASSLRAQIYESSSYAIENNVEKLIAYAEEGGAYKDYWYGDAEKIVDITLGTPKQGLMEMYSYDETIGDSVEYYIPALFFPIENISDGSVYYYRKAVIVPLVSDMMQYFGGDIPGIRPLLERDVENTQ